MTAELDPHHAGDMPSQAPAAGERARLEAEKAEVEAQIRAYPAPIPACDAQFNYLLERRAELVERIARK